MLTRGSELLGPFGVMGGFIQAQAHVQFVVELMRNGLDPQAALDRGRFRIDGSTLSLEQPLWESADELEPLGFKIERATEPGMFGGGQAIICLDECLAWRLRRPQGRVRARLLITAVARRWVSATAATNSRSRSAAGGSTTAPWRRARRPRTATAASARRRRGRPARSG